MSRIFLTLTFLLYIYTAEASIHSDTQSIAVEESKKNKILLASMISISLPCLLFFYSTMNQEKQDTIPPIKPRKVHFNSENQVRFFEKTEERHRAQFGKSLNKIIE